MGQDQDPYDDAGSFTPYQPAAEPSSEPPSEPPAEPSAGPAVDYYAATATATPRRTSATPWLIGIGILVLVVGAAVAGIVAFAGSLDIMDADVRVNDLDEGQCLSGAGFDPNTDEAVSELEITECDQAHDAQVLAINKLDRREVDDYDFDSSANAGEVCDPGLTVEQQALFDDGTYFLIAFTETREPEVGDKVACLVVREDGGPIRGFLP